MKEKLALLSLRWSVFIVMLMWTLDKFINPNHAAAVFNKFYLIEGLSLEASYVIGSIQLLLILGFVFGILKRFTYGAVFAMHMVSTLSTWKIYFDPWGPKNLLFFAAFPMLAALFSLYLLRKHDTLFTLKRAA